MTTEQGTANKLRDIYRRLFAVLGPQHWWPGETPFEIMVGAVLTQNTSWANVEKAIHNLKEHHLLTPLAIHRLSLAELQELIKPSGFYRVKARRLKALVGWLVEAFDGDLERMCNHSLDYLRPRLLAVKGIGAETADSILLYAAGKPAFVIDAYTRRVLVRHKLANEASSYDELKALFETHLPRRAALFNEYHALLVVAGKRWCRPRPLCAGCPLELLLPTSPAC